MPCDPSCLCLYHLFPPSTFVATLAAQPLLFPDSADKHTQIWGNIVSWWSIQKDIQSIQRHIVGQSITCLYHNHKVPTLLATWCIAVRMKELSNTPAIRAGYGHCKKSFASQDIWPPGIRFRTWIANQSEALHTFSSAITCLSCSSYRFGWTSFTGSVIGNCLVE